MSDPPRGTRTEPGSRRPPESDEWSGDDWDWDEVDWFEEARPQGSEPGSASGAGNEPRTGLIPAARDAGSQPSPAAQSAVIRRRRILAVAVLGVLFMLALVIPLVVFGGGGGAESTTSPATAARPGTAPAARTATVPRTTTRPPATTTSPATTPGTAPLRVVLPNGQALRRGDSGAAVENLQKGLAALGFATGTPDRDFGAATEAAVVDFQQSNNLTPDGIVGADTVRLLNAALAAKGVTG